MSEGQRTASLSFDALSKICEDPTERSLHCGEDWQKQKILVIVHAHRLPFLATDHHRERASSLNVFDVRAVSLSFCIRV